MVVDWNVERESDQGAPLGGRSVETAPGTVLEFVWMGEGGGSGGTETVHRLRDAAAFAGCDFSGATLLGASSPVMHEFEGGTEYFAEGAHCAQGHKLAVSVAGAGDAGATTGTAPEPEAEPTPVACEGTWSACDASCAKRFTATRAAAHGGDACPSSPAACAPEDSATDACRDAPQDDPQDDPQDALQDDPQDAPQDETGILPSGPTGCLDFVHCSGQGVASTGVGGECECTCLRGFAGSDCADVVEERAASAGTGAAARPPAAAAAATVSAAVGWLWWRPSI
jgi:hypothetical protein